MYDLSLTVQFTDWTIENSQAANQPPPRPGTPPATNLIKSSENTSHLSANIALARYWQLSNEQAILAGVMLAWSHQLAGNDDLTSANNPPPRRNNSPRTTNRGAALTPSRATAGDDNYGQFLAYISYELNSSWSIDIESAIELATDDNNQSWGLGLSYSF